MRPRVVVGVIALALATAAGGGCKKGAAGAKPYLETELETQHVVLQDIELDIKVPKGITQEPRGGTEMHWVASQASDTLDITIQVATPTVLQNAVNFESQTDRRISRSDTTADGWAVTSGDQDGGVLIAKKMIGKERRAIFCTAMMTWGKPAHDPKRNAWVEAICNSLVPTKFQ